jgi:hypothetical protein
MSLHPYYFLTHNGRITSYLMDLSGMCKTNGNASLINNLYKKLVSCLCQRRPFKLYTNNSKSKIIFRKKNKNLMYCQYRLFISSVFSNNVLFNYLTVNVIYVTILAMNIIFFLYVQNLKMIENIHR